jgi:hypothetical protein
LLLYARPLDCHNTVRQPEEKQEDPEVKSEAKLSHNMWKPWLDTQLQQRIWRQSIASYISKISKNYQGRHKN